MTRPPRPYRAPSWWPARRRGELNIDHLKHIPPDRLERGERRMRICETFRFAALLGLGLGAGAGATPDHRTIPGLEAAARVIDAEAAGHPNGSMTVAIVVRGRLAWIRSYGFA